MTYDGYQEMEHNSTPYPGWNGGPTGAPPPPPPAMETPTVMKPPAPTNGAGSSLNIEAAISRSITEYVGESTSFGTSLLLSVKRYVVPTATAMDIISAVLRIMTLTFFLTIPDLYAKIFTPAAGDGWAWGMHYTILIISDIGIALGIPVALFSSVYSLVTLKQKRESAEKIKVKRIRNQIVKFYKEKMRSAGGYIAIAFLCMVTVSIPYFLTNDPTFAKFKTIITEAVFITIPFVATIITMLTERESNADPQEKSTQIGSSIALFNIFGAGQRLSIGQGTFRDSAAVLGAMNGDLAASIEAGVAEKNDERYLTLGEIAERLGRSPAKDDPFRRTLNNIVGAAYRRAEYAIKKHPKKGYLVPESAFVPLFEKYMYSRPAAQQSKIIELKATLDNSDESNKKTKKAKPKGFFRRIVEVFAPSEQSA